MTTSEKYTDKMEQPVMEDKIKNFAECFNCKQATFYPVKCARCAEWRKRHSTPFLMPFRDMLKKNKAWRRRSTLCRLHFPRRNIMVIFAVSAKDYLSAIAWNEPPPSPFPTECANCGANCPKSY